MVDGLQARADQGWRGESTPPPSCSDAGMDVIDATQDLIRRYRLSERQVRRYVERAQSSPDEWCMTTTTPTVNLGSS